MQLPVDVKALIDEMTSVNAARETKLSVGMYIDNKAPGDVVAHVRAVFASVSPQVRMTISYLDASFKPHGDDDIAIIVAGVSRSIGAAAAALRASGVPTAVVTTLPATVGRIAGEGKHAVPAGDIVCPIDLGEDGLGGDEGSEPIELTDEMAVALDERLGAWIVSVCAEKRLAFAIAFPFMRRPLAIDAVQATSLQNAGIGLVPLIPGADLPIMTLNQAKMVLQIAAAYGQDMSKDRAKELLAVVGGAYVCRTIARELVEFVPILGMVVRAGIAYGGTSAIGHAVIGYFEDGQEVSGVIRVASDAAKKTSLFINETREDPQAAVERVRSKASQCVRIVRGKVDEYVPVARDLVAEYAPKARETVSEYAPIAKDLVLEYAPKVKEAVGIAVSAIKEGPVAETA